MIHWVHATHCEPVTLVCDPCLGALVPATDVVHCEPAVMKYVQECISEGPLLHLERLGVFEVTSARPLILRWVSARVAPNLAELQARVRPSRAPAFAIAFPLDHALRNEQILDAHLSEPFLLVCASERWRATVFRQSAWPCEGAGCLRMPASQKDTFSSVMCVVATCGPGGFH